MARRTCAHTSPASAAHLMRTHVASIRRTCAHTSPAAAPSRARHDLVPRRPFDAMARPSRPIKRTPARPCWLCVGLRAVPREMLETKLLAAQHHNCIVLGASGVGKSTLVSTFSRGNENPPAVAMPRLPVDGLSQISQSDESGGSDVGQTGGGLNTYWPTVGTKCSRSVVYTPGLTPLEIEVCAYS